MPPPATDTLENLVRSRLIEPVVLEKLLAVALDQTKSRTVDFIAFLQHRQEITPYQAQALSEGNWQKLRVGQYRLLYPIARGGMGSVYLADAGRSATGVERKLVALKILSPKRAKDSPRMLTRFQREVDICIQLPVHPHLMRTLDSGVEAGVHFLALEYLAGKTVRQLVQDHGPMPVGQAARIFCDVATGLQALHTAGFVHRDLKPGNVIVTPDGRAKIVDFGFALVHGEPPPADPTILGGQGYTVGTMDYLAPEQAQDASRVGYSADLYSLGCCLYYALTGSPPFPEANVQDKIRAHRNKYPPDLSMMNPTIASEFSRFIPWFMAKKPELRPQTAAEVAQYLQHWADAVPVITGRPAWTKPEAILQDVEARWQATRSDERDKSGELEDSDIDSGSEVRIRKPRSQWESIFANSGVRLPWWLIGLLVVAVSSMLTMVFVIGVVMAKLLRK